MRPVWLEPIAGPVLQTTGAVALHNLYAELLREWGSSEVWRLSNGPRSVIVKRGTDHQTAEASAYERFVVPLALPAPSLIHWERQGDAVLLVLADVGKVNLEQQPSSDGFLAAVDLLVSLRSKAVHGPSEFGPDRLKDLVGRIDAPLGHVVEVVAPALESLHEVAPLAVVHGDFVPKNLVTDGQRWTAIDWPAAHVAPHLRDLFTLVRDAVALGIESEPIVARYIDATGTDPALVRRQVLVGGVSFIVLALGWIADEGLRTVPESKNWIDPLLVELNDLTEQLR